MDENELGQLDEPVVRTRGRADDDDEAMDGGARGSARRERERDDAPADGARDGGTRGDGGGSGRARAAAADPNKIVLEISDDDAAFILGKGGKTKEKLVRVSGARIELYERSRTVEISGPADARARAKKYVQAVMAQRVGPVSIEDEEGTDDLTTLLVPHEAVGFVTGAQGNFLRVIEEEWGTLMFFAEYRGRRGPSSSADTEKLAIFGPRRARRGAHLKVLSAVEAKVRGFASAAGGGQIVAFADDDVDFGTETRELLETELSYALGKKGGTRKKLAASSECIVEYVGHTVYMCGSAQQRGRARQYLDWLFAQLRGPVTVDYAERDDCTVVEVPRDTVGYVTGAKRATLGRIEEEWGARSGERVRCAVCAVSCARARVRDLCVSLSRALASSSSFESIVHQAAPSPRLCLCACPGVLMFFMETRMQRDGREAREAGGTEKLAIFGPQRGRRGAELKVLSAVETKNPGHSTTGHGRSVTEAAWGTDVYPLTEAELSYALGKDGVTRRKLATASGAIVEYIGYLAHLAGTTEERHRARDYLKWLLKQRNG
jgi:hypothetical protein